MHKSKLLQLLQSLTPKEFRKLGEMVYSPVYNKNEPVQKLFGHIQQYYPQWEHEQLAKEKTHKVVFPKAKYNDKYLRAIMSDLAQLTEVLLIQSQLDGDPFLKKHLLWQAADRRSMERLREEALNEMAFTLADTATADENLYHQRLETEKSRYEHLLKTRNRSIGPVLQQLLERMDVYYVLQKLKYTCEAINRSAILAEEYKLFMTDEILAQLRQGTFHDMPVVMAYYRVLLTLKENDEEEHYHELKRLLAENVSEIPLTEMKVLYAYAQNYCIRKINTGRNAYLKELFELYKRLLEDGIIFDNHLLTQWDFKNMVSVSLRVGETGWTEEFIHRYKNRLAPSQRDNAVQYNQAQLNFYKQQYGKVVRILQTVEFTDVFYNLDSRSLLLKTYYELNEFEALFSFSDTFGNYLRRNKQLSAYQRTIYLNLVKFITRLARVKIGDRNISHKLKIQIETSSEVADATWLKSKVVELG